MNALQDSTRWLGVALACGIVTFAVSASAKKPAKPEIEIISDIVSQFKNSMEASDVPKIKNLSEFEAGREQFVDQFFAAAQFPLMHIPVKRAYTATELAARLAPYLGNSEAIPLSPAPAEMPTVSTISSDAPPCPKCGDVMVLRTAKSGAK